MVRQICSIEGCEKPVTGWGWCNRHYQRWTKHGDPLANITTVYETPEESFAARTERRGDCLIWTGAANKDGYGKISVDGRQMLSHRYAWERVKGQIPDGVLLDHTCRTPACCNPEHLRFATRKQNAEHLDKYSTNTAGYRGVIWEKRRRKWIARVSHHGKVYQAGSFDTPEDAGEAARLKRLELFTHNNLDRVA